MRAEREGLPEGRLQAGGGAHNALMRPVAKRRRKWKNCAQTNLSKAAAKCA